MSDEPKPDALPLGMTEAEVKELRKTPMRRLFGMLKDYGDEPRICVLVTHGFIELVVNGLIDHTCKNAKKIADNNRDFPHSVKLTMLHENGTLKDHHYNLLNWFRKLRNKAAHDPLFELTVNDLDVFAEDRHRDPTQVARLCYEIMLEVFRLKANVVGPVLDPSMYKTVPGKPTLVVKVPAPKHIVPLKSDPKWVVKDWDEPWGEEWNDDDDEDEDDHDNGQSKGVE